jgi:hypothetical protein
VRMSVWPLGLTAVDRDAPPYLARVWHGVCGSEERRLVWSLFVGVVCLVEPFGDVLGP